VHNSLTIFERRKEYITTSMFTLGKTLLAKLGGEFLPVNKFACNTT